MPDNSEALKLLTDTGFKPAGGPVEPTPQQQPQDKIGGQNIAEFFGIDSKPAPITDTASKLQAFEDLGNKQTIQPANRLNEKLTEAVQSTSKMGTPRTVEDSIEFWRKRGIALNQHHSAYQNIDQDAKVHTLQAIGNIKLVRENLTPKEFMQLSNAYRDLLTLWDAPMSPDEGPRVIRHASSIIIDKTLSAIDDSLKAMREGTQQITFDARGARIGSRTSDVRTARRMEHLETLRNKFQGYKSRLNEPAIQEAFRNLIWRAHWDTREQFKQPKSAAQRRINALEWFAQDVTPPSEADGNLQTITGTKRSWEATHQALMPDSRELLRDLKTILVRPENANAASNLLVDSFELSLNVSRLELMGVPPEHRGIGIEGAIAFTHKDIYEQILAKALARESERQLAPELAPVTIKGGIIKRQQGFVDSEGNVFGDIEFEQIAEQTITRDKLPVIEKWYRTKAEKTAGGLINSLAYSQSNLDLAEKIRVFNPKPIIESSTSLLNTILVTGDNLIGKRLFQDLAGDFFRDAINSVNAGFVISKTGNFRFGEGGRIEVPSLVDVWNTITRSPGSGKHLGTKRRRLPENRLEALKQQIAQGKVDPGTLYRVIVDNEEVGALQDLGFIMAANATPERIADQLGPIARNAPETLAVADIARVMNEEWGKTISAALSTGGGLITEEELQATDQRTARLLRQKGIFHPETAKAIFSGFVNRISRNARDAFQIGLQDTSVLPTIIGLTYITGAATRPFFRIPKGFLARLMTRSLQARRITKRVADLAFHSPEDAKRMKTILGKARVEKMTDAAQESSLRSAEASLDRIINEYEGIPQGTNPSFESRIANEQINPASATRKFRQALNQLPNRTLLEIWDELDLPQAIRHEIEAVVEAPGRLFGGDRPGGTRTTPGIGNIIRAISDSIGEKIGWNKRQILPHLAEKAENIAASLEALRTAGLSPAEALKIRDGLVFSLNAYKDGAGPLREWVRGKIINPIFRRKTTPRGVQTQSLYRDLVDFGMTYLEAGSWLQLQQGMQRGRQIAMMEQIKNKARNRARYKAAELAFIDQADRGPVLAELQRLNNLVDQVDNDIKLVNQQPLDDGNIVRKANGKINSGKSARMANRDYYRNIDLIDVHSVLVMDGHAPRGILDIYTEIGLKGEKFADFEKAYTLALEGTGDPKFIRSVKTRIANAYFDQDSLSTIARDLTTDELTLPRKSQAVIAERKAAARKLERLEDKEAKLEADEKLSSRDRRALEKLQIQKRDNPSHFDPAKNFGFQIINLPEGVKQIRRWANTGNIDAKQKTIIGMGMLNSGDINAQLKAINAIQASQRFKVADKIAQNEEIAAKYNRLTKKQQDAYNKAILDWQEDGNAKTLQQFLDDNPEMLVIGDGTPDQNIRALLLERESFRQGLLHDFAAVLPADVIADLRRPYAPQLFETYESGAITGRHLKEIEPERKAFEVAANVKLMDLTEFMSRRDLQKYTVKVKPKGQPTIIEKFDTAEKAEAWLRERHGISGKPERSKGDITGQTRLKNAFQILKPLGLRRGKEVLKLLDPAQADFIRFRDLIRDRYMHEYLQLHDRPGWSMTKAEFNKWRKVPENREFAKDFIEVGDSDRYGPLKNKFVHKRVIHNMEYATEFDRVMRGIAEQAAQIEEGGVGFARIIPKIINKTSKLTHFMRQSLISNQIVRSISTVLNNIIYDRDILARMADPSYLYTKQGNDARRMAWKMLFGTSGWMGTFKEGIKHALGRRNDSTFRGFIDPELHKLDDFERQLFNEIRRNGIIGDAMYGALNSGDQIVGAEMLFGKAPEGAIKTAIPRIAKALGGQRGVDLIRRHFDDAFDDPRIKKLQDRVDFLEKELDNPDPDLTPTDLLQLERERLEKIATLKDIDIDRVGQRALWGKALAWVTGHLNERGLGKSVPSISREVYGRMSNVHRVGLYIHKRMQGWGEDAAKDFVNRFMQNYAGAPRELNTITKSWAGAAIASFPYEMGRITKNWIVDRPGKYLALSGAIPMVNAFSMAAAGVDPYQVFQILKDQSGGLPAYMAFMSMPWIATGPREGDFMGAPGLNWFSMFRSPMGALGGLIRRESFPEGAFGEVLYSAAAFGSKFIFNQPVPNFIASMITGRDPITQRHYESNRASFLDGMKNMAKLVLHPMMPIAGSIPQEIGENVTRPTTKAGRDVTRLEAVVQGVTGFRLRGGILNRIANSVIGEKNMDRAAKVLSIFTGREALKFGLSGKQNTRKAYLNSLIWESKKTVDPEGPDAGSIVDLPMDETRADMRLGLSHINEGKKRKDKAQELFGRKLFDEAAKRYLEQQRTRNELNGELVELEDKGVTIPGILEQRPQSLINRTAAVMNMSNTEANFQEIALPRQIWVLRKMSENPQTTEQEMRQFVALAFMSEKGTPKEIQQQARILENWLQTAGPIKGREELTSLLLEIQRRFPDKWWKQEWDNWIDESKRGAIEFLDENEREIQKDLDKATQ